MKKIHWNRLFWVIFITIYTALFFYNCFSPFANWILPYMYTMLLILWLAREYYLKRLFFQSGLLPYEKYGFPLRALFALVFYSAFIIGIVTVVAWPAYRMRLYPLFPVLGIILLLYSIFIREQAMRTETISAVNFTRFYYSIAMLMVSVSLGYGSYFLFLYVLIIGLPLVLVQERAEERAFLRFVESMAGLKKSGAEVDRRQYIALWEKYQEKESSGRK